MNNQFDTELKQLIQYYSEVLKNDEFVSELKALIKKYRPEEIEPIKCSCWNQALYQWSKAMNLDV